ncbi:MAG: radical SAM protein, partial [Lachnospiraceae bacterium]|nr:radical SAM protein [Lachnospiraceae bacterium]
QFKQLLEELHEQAEIDIRIGVPLSIDTECHKCEAAKGKLNIKYDGNVFPCEVFKNERMSHCLKEIQPESIYKKPLIDIYTNSSYLSLVRELEQEFLCTGKCETCIGQYLINKEGK